MRQLSRSTWPRPQVLVRRKFRNRLVRARRHAVLPQQFRLGVPAKGRGQRRSARRNLAHRHEATPAISHDNRPGPVSRNSDNPKGRSWGAAGPVAKRMPSAHKPAKSTLPARAAVPPRSRECSAAVRRILPSDDKRQEFPRVHRMEHRIRPVLRQVLQQPADRQPSDPQPAAAWQRSHPSLRRSWVPMPDSRKGAALAYRPRAPPPLRSRRTRAPPNRQARWSLSDRKHKRRLAESWPDHNRALRSHVARLVCLAAAVDRLPTAHRVDRVPHSRLELPVAPRGPVSVAKVRSWPRKRKSLA